MIGFDYDLKEIKGKFFDRNIVINAVDRATHRVLNRWGGKVRTTARRSIRKARQKKIGELTKDERRRWRIAQAIGKKKGYKARRPYKSSEPGEPHRWRTGLIKKHIYYLYEQAKRSVIIGPARLSGSSNAPEVLEYGGLTDAPDMKRKIRIDARPTMQLARDKMLPELERLWKDSVR